MGTVRVHSLLIAIFLLTSLGACNNPFDTRDPENPGTGGAAIKPANTPENVLYNLRASFESLSIQDYLDVFAADFTFHPDTEDSLRFEQDYSEIWDMERETEFAGNFLLHQNFRSVSGNPIELTASYEYKSGLDYYEYHYQMFIPLAAVSGKPATTLEVEGYAFLYLREDNEGNWAIYNWEDHRLTSQSLTWGALRAQYI
jgi:hypothetical protein